MYCLIFKQLIFLIILNTYINLILNLFISPKMNQVKKGIVGAIFVEMGLAF